MVKGQEERGVIIFVASIYFSVAPYIFLSGQALRLDLMDFFYSFMRYNYEGTCSLTS